MGIGRSFRIAPYFIRRYFHVSHTPVRAVENAPCLRKQPLDLDQVFYFSPLPEGNIKDEGDYLCYGDISGRIRQMSESRPFRLIEYRGMELCRYVRGWVHVSGVHPC